MHIALTNWKWLSFVIEFIKIDLVLMKALPTPERVPFVWGIRVHNALRRNNFNRCMEEKVSCVLNPFRINGVF